MKKNAILECVSKSIAVNYNAHDAISKFQTHSGTAFSVWLFAKRYTKNQMKQSKRGGFL